MEKNKHSYLEEIYNQMQQMTEEQLLKFFKKEIGKIAKMAQTYVDNIDTKSDLLSLQEENEEETEEENDFSNELYRVGTKSTDYKFYNIDHILYDELDTRTQEILKKAEDDFMGFRTQPMISKNELITEISMNSDRINALIQLKTPRDLMVGEFERFKTKLKSFINKEYGDNSCKKYCKSVKEFYSKQFDWYKSQKYKTLCNQLVQYNTIAFEQREKEILSTT